MRCRGNQTCHPDAKGRGVPCCRVSKSRKSISPSHARRQKITDSPSELKSRGEWYFVYSSCAQFSLVRLWITANDTKQCGRRALNYRSSSISFRSGGISKSLFKSLGRRKYCEHAKRNPFGGNCTEKQEKLNHPR